MKISYEESKEIAKAIIPNAQITFTCGLIGSSGAAILRAVLDGHPEIYTLHFELRKVPVTVSDFSRLNREEHLELLLNNNERFFDSREDKSSVNPLNYLGSNQDQYIAFSKEKFQKYLECILSVVPFNQRNYSLAISMSYNFARNIVPEGNKFVFHTHDLPCAKKFVKGFDDGQILTICRHPLNVYESFCRRKFNVRKDSRYTDKPCDFLEYYQPSNVVYFKELYDTINDLPNCISIVHLEQLHQHPEKTVRQMASKLNISFNESLMNPTIGGLKWWGSHYTRIPGFSSQLHTKIRVDYVGYGDAYAMLIACHKLQLKLGYTSIKNITPYMRLRSRFACKRYIINRLLLLKESLSGNLGLLKSILQIKKCIKDILVFIRIRIKYEYKYILELSAEDEKCDLNKLHLISKLFSDAIIPNSKL